MQKSHWKKKINNQSGFTIIVICWFWYSLHFQVSYICNIYSKVRTTNSTQEVTWWKLIKLLNPWLHLPTLHSSSSFPWSPPPSALLVCSFNSISFLTLVLPFWIALFSSKQNFLWFSGKVENAFVVSPRSRKSNVTFWELKFFGKVKACSFPISRTLFVTVNREVAREENDPSFNFGFWFDFWTVLVFYSWFGFMGLSLFSSYLQLRNPSSAWTTARSPTTFRRRRPRPSS